MGGSDARESTRNTGAKTRAETMTPALRYVVIGITQGHIPMNLNATLKKTRNTIEKALIGKAGGERDILDQLKEEHEEVAEMLEQLVKSERAGERKALLAKIKAALIPHVRAEEKIVYDAVIALKDKQPKLDGEEGYLEHGLADRMLMTLSRIQNAMSPEFSAASKVLKELITHHVEEEERNVWSDVKKNFSKEDRIAMYRRFQAAKTKVRIPS
jgi:hemerythrin-like domain-containing protein